MVFGSIVIERIERLVGLRTNAIEGQDALIACTAVGACWAASTKIP